MKRRNWLNTLVKPMVYAVEVAPNPTPKRLLNWSRKNVEATLNINVITMRLLWRRLRNRSFRGKP
jgi:hypothetical protein